ncbi:ADR017Wp [Eremothecium gossypii ATCC 10895]|uniref:ADR017Wp n=1 Tax=Eremothecium gossypii (strain ATCC 10895 / CBS 109.51 / FGSC 9923 / NRRL Y-1056) TaxID=284811 RepID=Q75AA1_EREGS|nr:ADR017Wp [Eremothecium gossypii ATCC 10895]AAS51937.1 ADR017Wp [Eremothecium gossypii ATCC 10895]AEY96237.1 FADR017Wp [Eremothecium gossypii FDAG1]
MNQIRSIQKLSETELEHGILSEEASWHYQYKDQAYIHFSGLNVELTEGDILTVFSQFGVPTDLKLVRDRETGESRGFGFLKYEDQRSTVLAVDNLNGVNLCGRVLKVDHCFYEPRDEDEAYVKTVREELARDLVDVEVGTTAPIQGKITLTEDAELADPMGEFLSSKKDVDGR